MIDDRLLQKIIKEARDEETRRGMRIPEIYIVGENYYFDRDEVEGMDVDYTLCRTDMDPNIPDYGLNTYNHLPKEPWDA